MKTSLSDARHLDQNTRTTTDQFSSGFTASIGKIVMGPYLIFYSTGPAATDARDSEAAAAIL